jgi:Domain of unknown function (DUF4145)
MSDKKVMRCGHCGKDTLFEVKAEGTRGGIVSADDLMKHSEYDADTMTTWRVLECNLCHEPTLLEEAVMYEVDTYGEIAGVLQQRVEPIKASESILYPGKTPLDGLPKEIETRYLKALKAQDVEPSVFAVMIGRTLEAVCNHEQVPGRNLKEQIDNLIQFDRIPKPLSEMAHQIRQIRNLGAHDAEDEVSKKDVPIIREFIDAILEFLYIVPAKTAAIQARLKKTHKPSS